MTITFYQYTGVRRKVDKNLNTVAYQRVTITSDKIAGNQDMITPRIIVSSTQARDLVNYNYAYIQDWGRYYFITDRTWIAENIYELALEEDVLYTFKDNLQNGEARGIVHYSALGSRLLKDPRITFQPYASVGVRSWDVTDKSYIALRYWTINGTASQPMARTLRCALFTRAGFDVLMSHFSALDSINQGVVAACIQDVTEVHYLNETALLYNFTRYNGIKFQPPGQTVSVTLTIQDGSEPPTSDLWIRFINKPEDVALLEALEIATPATLIQPDFWDLEASWTFRLPYAGDITFTPAGQGTDFISYVSVMIAYEPYENCYIITPYINDRLAVEFQQVLPVTTSQPFPVDQSRLDTMLSRLGILLPGATNIGLSLATGNIAGVIGSALGTANSFVKNEVQASQGYRIIGGAGGSPAYTTQLDGGKVYWIKTTSVPKNATEIRNSYNLPDETIRYIGSEFVDTGYAEIELPGIWTGFANASKRETDMLIAALREGAWF